MRKKNLENMTYDRSENSNEIIMNENNNIEKVSFETAFSSYKKKRPDRVRLVKDKEAMLAFVSKRLPKMATQDEFDKVFDKF